MSLVLHSPLPTMDKIEIIVQYAIKKTDSFSSTSSSVLLLFPRQAKIHIVKKYFNNNNSAAVWFFFRVNDILKLFRCGENQHKKKSVLFYHVRSFLNSIANLVTWQDLKRNMTIVNGLGDDFYESDMFVDLRGLISLIESFNVFENDIRKEILQRMVTSLLQNVNVDMMLHMETERNIIRQLRNEHHLATRIRSWMVEEKINVGSNNEDDGYATSAFVFKQQQGKRKNNNNERDVDDIKKIKLSDDTETGTLSNHDDDDIIDSILQLQQQQQQSDESGIVIEEPSITEEVKKTSESPSSPNQYVYNEDPSSPFNIDEHDDEETDRLLLKYLTSEN